MRQDQPVEPLDAAMLPVDVEHVESGLDAARQGNIRPWPLSPPAFDSCDVGGRFMDAVFGIGRLFSRPNRHNGNTDVSVTKRGVEHHWCRHDRHTLIVILLHQDFLSLSTQAGPADPSPCSSSLANGADKSVASWSEARQERRRLILRG